MDLPRISRSFRAHLSIEPTRQLKPNDILKHRLLKSKQNNRLVKFIIYFSVRKIWTFYLETLIFQIINVEGRISSC